MIGKHKRSREKDQPYECGIRPRAMRASRFPSSSTWWPCCLSCSISKRSFLYPWALVYSDLKVFGFVEMLLYIIILLAGYIYLWKKGALDWSH